MANLTTTSDILLSTLSRVGELESSSSPYYTKALEYINEIYLKILGGANVFDLDMGEPWVWAKSQYPGVLQLNPVNDTGTVTLTKASTSGTFSSAPSTSMAGYYLKIDDRPEYFRIATHTASATAFTLDAAYTDTSGSGLTFKAIPLNYSLTSSVLRLFEPMVVYRDQGVLADEDGKIYGIDLNSLKKEYPLTRLEQGVPTRFAQFYDTDGTISVRFNKYVETETRVEYEYIPIPTALTASPDLTPLIPREFREALVYGAAYFLCLDKDDSRADSYLQITQAVLRAMMKANRKELKDYGLNRGRLLPRYEQVVASTNLFRRA